MSRHYSICLIILIFFLCISFSVFSQEKPSGELAKFYVTLLASDSFEGRDTGTPGFEKAVSWVVEQYQKWNLTPAGENGTYIQKFPFSFFKNDFENPQLTINGRKFYSEDDDFRVLRYSSGGKIKGEVVFVGYGICAADKNLDEYAGIDVTNKIVLFMHGCPENDEEEWENFFTDSAKIATAQNHGAIGALICADFKQEDRGVGYWRLRPENYQKNFIVFGVDERVVKLLLKKDNETDSGFTRRMTRQQENLDHDLISISLTAGKKVSMSVKIEYNPNCVGKNVIGMIKGTDPDIGDEAIVIGGHLDHLGIRQGLIYNGADDNATGSAVVMEIARVMKKNKIAPKRTIIFACWGGEERGLLGSRHYADHPTIPIEKTVLNFNIDMVGLGSKLGFPGIYYAPKIWEIISENSSEEILAFIEPKRGGPGGSDHTPFITRGVPAFALMTSPWNDHPDYHQPGDDAEKIDANLLEKVAQFVYDNALLVANSDQNLIEKNRYELYIHKSAIIANLNPMKYEPGLGIIDSLENEWIDIQFVEVSLDSLEFPSEKLAALVKSLDNAAQESANPLVSDNSPAALFSSRREDGAAIVGLHGAHSVNSDISQLRIAAKMGAKFFIFDGFDDQWITLEQGVTKSGKNAIREMNKSKILIVVQNLPDSVVVPMLELSRHPIIVAGNYDVENMNEDLLESIEENKGLLALGFCPGKEAEKIVADIESLKRHLNIKYLGIYPGFGHQIDFSHLDKLFNLTVLLHGKNFSEDEIKNLLGNNLRRILFKIYPRDRGRMRWRF